MSLRTRSVRFLLAAPSGQLLLCLVAAALLSVHLGLDDNWDLQNYHLYGPFALLQGRFRQDLNAVGNQSTFFPLIDVPYYLLAKSWLPHSARVVCFLAGFPYGALAFVLLQVSLQMDFPHRIHAAWIATLIGMTGTTVVSEIGTTFGDIPVAVLVVAGLWCTLRGLGSGHWGRGCALAGVACGLAFALKLTAVIFIPAFLAGILAAGPGLVEKLLGTALFLTACVLCFLCVYGPWGWFLWTQFGNPVFPFLNDVFHSGWGDPAFVHATKFFPRSALQALFYPFWWLHGRAGVASETGVRDWHFALAYITICTVAVSALWLRRAPDRRVRLLYIFAAVAFATWEMMFSILRYAITLEVMTGPVLVAGLAFALGFFNRATKGRQEFFFEKKNQKTFIFLGVGLLVFLLVTSGWPGWGRVRQTPGTIFDVVGPVVPDDATVAVAGEPIGFVIPFLRGRNLRFLGTNAPEHTRLDREIAAQLTHAAILRILMLGGDQQATRQLQRLGLQADPATCTRISTGRRDWGPILLCSVTRHN